MRGLEVVFFKANSSRFNDICTGFARTLKVCEKYIGSLKNLEICCLTVFT